MQIVRRAQDMQCLAAEWRARDKRIGLVPTMGYLHEAHLSLIRIARQHADVVVVSIFVNPTQFGPHEDFGRYPRDFERDEELCRREHADVVFYPAVEEMYPRTPTVFVEENPVSCLLEGATRPGHFRGVLTVVAKLFNLCLPQVAVFGRKDAQQLFLVKRMVQELNFPVEIVAGEIVREPDGLAMSSRNVYLSPDQRAEAPALQRALREAEQAYLGGEKSAGRLKRLVASRIAGLHTGKLDYVEVVGEDTFEPLAEVHPPASMVMAVFFGKTRLLDNLKFEI